MFKLMDKKLNAILCQKIGLYRPSLGFPDEDASGCQNKCLACIFKSMKINVYIKK